jgi:hypothetical protein
MNGILHPIKAYVVDFTKAKCFDNEIEIFERAVRYSQDSQMDCYMSTVGYFAAVASPIPVRDGMREIFIGWSLCSPIEVFDPTLGKLIAISRCLDYNEMVEKRDGVYVKKSLLCDKRYHKTYIVTDNPEYPPARYPVFYYLGVGSQLIFQLGDFMSRCMRYYNKGYKPPVDEVEKE